MDKFKDELTRQEVSKLLMQALMALENITNIEETIGTLVDVGRDVVVADRCTLWIYNEEDESLWTYTGHGLELKKLEIDCYKGLVGYCVTRDEDILVNDVYNDNRFDKSIDQFTGYTTRNTIVIPIHDENGNIIGAYQVINKLTQNPDFNTDDIEKLKIAASTAAKALNNYI